MRKGMLELFMGLFMVLMTALIFYRLHQDLVVSAESTGYVVVLDAGHGGNDPGKVGVDGTLEKDINLSLVYKLKEVLEAADVTVILTREEDHGLYQDSDTNKKRADMERDRICAAGGHAFRHQSDVRHDDVRGRGDRDR